MSLVSWFVKTAPATKARDRVVGIDIGASALKVVELEERDGVVTLMTYGELQLGPYDNEKPIGQVTTLTPALERQALIDILRESAVKAKKAVLAVPLSSSFVTTMNLIAPADEDLAPRIRVEAKKYIPVPIADVTLDWAEIGAPVDESDTRDVLLAAIQNDALKRFMTLMQTVELPAPPTEIECFSAIRAITDSTLSSIAIIDLGAAVTKLYLVKDGLLERMYRIPTGGMRVSERLAEERKISFAEAETLKRQVAVGTEEYASVQKNVGTVLLRSLKEIHQVIDEYEARSGNTIEKIFLTGGGALFPGIDAWCAHELARSVAVARPFEKVAYPAFMEDTLRQIGPQFATALGAALRIFE